MEDPVSLSDATYVHWIIFGEILERPYITFYPTVIHLEPHFHDKYTIKYDDNTSRVRNMINPFFGG